MRTCLPLSVLIALTAWGVVAEPLPAGRPEMAEDGLRAPGPSTAAWVPYPSSDPLIWAADACLGFFLTRSVAALGQGAAVAWEADGLGAEFGERQARIRVETVPPDGAGGFRCASQRWPEIAPSAARLEAVATWIDDRLRAGDGWKGWFEAENPGGLRFRTVAEYRNEELGVTLRIEALHDHPMRSDYMVVGLEQDSPGGPLLH